MKNYEIKRKENQIFPIHYTSDKDNTFNISTTQECSNEKNNNNQYFPCFTQYLEAKF